MINTTSVLAQELTQINRFFMLVKWNKRNILSNLKFDLIDGQIVTKYAMQTITLELSDGAYKLTLNNNPSHSINVPLNAGSSHKQVIVDNLLLNVDMEIMIHLAGINGYKLTRLTLDNDFIVQTFELADANGCYATKQLCNQHITTTEGRESLLLLRLLSDSTEADLSMVRYPTEFGSHRGTEFTTSRDNVLHAISWLLYRKMYNQVCLDSLLTSKVEEGIY